MVQFGVDTVEAAMKLGKEAAEYISGTFIKVGVSNYFTRSWIIFCFILICLILHLVLCQVWDFKFISWNNYQVSTIPYHVTTTKVLMQIV